MEEDLLIDDEILFTEEELNALGNRFARKSKRKVAFLSPNEDDKVYINSVKKDELHLDKFVVVDRELYLGKPLEELINTSADLIIYLPPGEFYLDETLLLKNISNVEIRGSTDKDGYNNTILSISENKPSSLMKIINCSNVTLCHLNLFGPHTYKIESTGLEVADSSDILVQQCCITEFARAGIDFVNSNGIVTQSKITDSCLTDTRGKGYDFETTKNMGYGVFVNSSHVLADYNTFERCSHALASGCNNNGLQASYIFTNNVVNKYGAQPTPQGTLALTGAGVDVHESHQGGFVIGNNNIHKTNLGVHIRGGSGVIYQNVFHNCKIGIRIGKCLGKDYEKFLGPQYVRVMPNNHFLNTPKEVIYTQK